MKILLLSLLILCLVMPAMEDVSAAHKPVVPGVRITSVKTGNWNSASTWNVKIPTGVDTVVIDNNHVITLDGNCYLHYLKSNTGGVMNFTPSSNLIYQ